MSGNIVLSVLLPVRNEGLNLKIMLKILRAVLDVPHEVLVVYDHDGDTSVGTVQAIQKNNANVHLVKNDLGPGVANAITAGVRRATGEYILLFAADEVGPVLAIEDMLALMQNMGCQFVSCTRYAHGGRRLGGSVIGGICSRIANRLFYILSGSALTDATTGIKLFRRDLYPTLQLKAKSVGWSVAFEMSMKAQLSGFKMGEVPIVSIDRLYGGKSTFRFGPWMIEYMKWFIWGSVRLHRASGWRRPKAIVRRPAYMCEG